MKSFIKRVIRIAIYVAVATLVMVLTLELLATVYIAYYWGL
ncbi:MAG: hypothetical protein PHI12_12305 [Dehalococcoidales bacterium]|jgi:riboflavin transporter FmnP|nr:hypothetical protein [Dehalococcoidales bacterium]